MPGNVRKQIRDAMPAFPVWAKRPGRFHHALRRAPFAGIGNCPGVVECDLLSVEAFEIGLKVEAIDMTRPALHKEKNDPFRLRRRRGNGWCQRP